MAAEIPAKFVGLEKSAQEAAKKAGRNLKINLGTSSKSVEALSQPLGRITGKADEFTKSMEAANARVLAFGASVGVLRAVTNSFKELVVTTIQVEKQMASINAILGASTSEINQFKKEIFDVARNTEQSFDTVATAALELSRQGLGATEVVKRLNDSLILSRLSGQSAADAVAGLTSAINGFKSAGITSAQVVNKFSEAAKSAAVSERDLAEAFKRAGAVAGQAGVSFDELVGIVSAVQEKTSRGGSVIGNSFKTIFTRIQSLDKLKTMQELGVQVTNASGDILSATELIQNLAGVLESFPDARRLQIAEGLVGKFQVAPFISILEDYNDETSKAIKITEISARATTAAYERNEALNKTLSAAINEVTVNLAQLGDMLGKIGVTDSLQNVLGFFNSMVEGLKGLLDEKTGSDIAKGLVKGIGSVISGPGLAIFAAVIGKLTLDLVKFGTGSLKTFFGLNKAAKAQASLQGQIASSLLNNKQIQDAILKIERSSLSAEEKKLQQTKFFTTALNEQFAVMQKMQGIARRVAPGVMAGTRRGRGAGGYIPNFAGGSVVGSEQADINRGVGGAPRSARPVSIPNFNFGGGQRGTMVANTSEFIVPNFAGGSAIFNQNMASSMGLPPGARRVGAAGGYIPNFAKASSSVNSNKQLVLFTGTRGPDNANRTLFAGKSGKETRAYTSMPPKDVKSVRQVVVPTFNIGPKGTNKGGSRDINDIKKGLSEAGSNQAKLFAKEISGKGKLPTLTNKQIEKLFNPGAFEAFAGTVFEVSLGAILGSKQFLDFASRTSTSRIDLPYSSRLFNKFGVPEGVGKMGAEAKANDGTELLKSAAIKFYDILFGGAAVASFKKQREGADDKKRNTFLGATVGRGDAQKFGITTGSYDKIRRNIQADTMRSKSATVTKGDIMLFKQRAASGYIPNFVGALENAIGREAAAGLPINQIRVNQKGSLRNAGNPMGLAVTNTRDEPTGAIPNFVNELTQKSVFGGNVSKFAVMERGFTKLGPVLDKLNNKIKQLEESISKGSMSHKKAGKVLDKYTQTITKNTNISAADSSKLAAASKQQLSGTKKAERGQRDMLGTVFAVQMGLSLLAGATSDAEKGFGRFTNRLTSALSTVTTAALAGSALGQFGDSFKDTKPALGKFLKGLGGVSIAFGAVVGGVKFFKNIINDASGETDAAAKNMAFLSDAANTAGRALNSLGEVGQILAKDEAEEILKKSGLRFKTEEQEKQMMTAVSRAVAAGVGEKGILDIIGRGRKDPNDPNKTLKGGPRTSLELRSIQDELTQQSIVSSKSIDQLFDNFFADPKALNQIKSTALKNEFISLRNSEDPTNAMKLLGGDAGIFKLGSGFENEMVDKNFKDIDPSLIITKGDKNRIGDLQIELLKRFGTEQSEFVFNLLRRRVETFTGGGGLAAASEAGNRIQVDKAKQLITEQINNLKLQQAGISPVEEAAARAGKGMLMAGPAMRAKIGSANLQMQEKTINEFMEMILGAIDVTKNLDVDSPGFKKAMEFLKSIKFEDIKDLGSVAKKKDVSVPGTSGSNPFQIIEGFGKSGTLEKFLKLLGTSDLTGPQIEKLTRELQIKQQTLQIDLAKVKAQEELNRLLNIIPAQTRAGMVSASAQKLVDSGSLQLQSLTAGQAFDRLKAKSDLKFARDQMAAGNDLDLHLAANQAKILRDTLVSASETFSQNISDGLVDAIIQGKSLKDTLLSAATDFFTMMSKAYMKKAVDSIVTGDGGGGGIMGFVGNMLGIKLNSGGMIRGGSGTRDDVPALLTGGEFVMRKSSVNKYGTGFMSALNQGAVPKFANGGMFVPGSYGQGDIRGKSNLLGFATQTGTSTSFDKLIGGSGFAGVALAPESLMMTNLGRSMSPAFKRTQESKSQAFSLYIQQLQADEQRKEQLKQQAEAKKQQKRGLFASLGMAALSGFVFGGGLKGLGGIFGGRKSAGGLTSSYLGETGGRFGFDLNKIDTTAPNAFEGNQITPPQGADLGRGLDPALFQSRPMGGMIPYMAGGGGVGYAAGVDTVPAMLSGGEFVMNAAATSRIGASNLQALNSGASMGGGSTSVTKGDTNINIVVNSDGSSNQSSSPDTESADKGLAVRLKDAVKGVIAEETRLGGMLSA